MSDVKIYIHVNYNIDGMTLMRNPYLEQWNF